MSMILCRQEPVKHPFYFEGLGISLFSSQELCYVIYNNPLLVMDEFVDNNLIHFIREDLDMAFLAAKLEKYIQSGDEPDELLTIILHECDYYTVSEVDQFQQKLATYRQMPVGDFLKAKADYFFSGKQYGKAIAGYSQILELPKSDRGDDDFCGKIYNNLGAAYARLFMTDKACQAYQKSFDLTKNPEILKRICLLLQWNPNLLQNERYQDLITDEMRQECETKAKEAEVLAAGADSLKELEQMFQKEPIKRLQEAGELIQKWKQEYRNIMS